MLILATQKNKLGADFVLQGNLSPVSLFTNEPDILENNVRHIMSAFPKNQGHIFNLGHGIHPTTPMDNVARLVDLVEKYSQNKNHD